MNKIKAWIGKHKTGIKLALLAAGCMVMDYLTKHPLSTGLLAMAWPATSGSGSYTATGRTTIRWGTEGIWQNEFPSGGGYYTVTRVRQHELADMTKLPNGTGPTVTRVIIVDGVQWDVTVRDDTTMTPPKVNDRVVVVDTAGHFGTPGLKYRTTVVDSNYEAAVKQAGERGLVLERLILIEPSQSGDPGGATQT